MSKRSTAVKGVRTPRDAGIGFGRRLADLRARLDLTQAEVAHVLGVSLNTVQRWEADRSRPMPLAVRAVEGIEALLQETQGVLKPDQLGAWFHTRIDSLDGRRPLDVLADPRGVERVSHAIGRIEWGIAI